MIMVILKSSTHQTQPRHRARVATLAFVTVLCVWLLALDFYGLIYPIDLRGKFDEPLLSYSQVLDRIQEARNAYGASPRFFTEATQIYDAGTAYEWPQGMARVAWRDNWILAIAAYFDPLIHWLGLKKDAELFIQFESYHYERALGRGFGICSQNALGLADLLYRKYGDDIHLVGLNGHVVTQVTLPDHSQMILDPSVGVALQYSLAQAESNLPAVRDAYNTTKYPDLANIYNHEGNFIAPDPGAKPYWPRPPVQMRILESASDVLIWVIPVIGLLFVAFLQLHAVRNGPTTIAAQT